MVTKLVLGLVFLKFMFCLCYEEHLNITRMRYNNLGGDEFQIPSSLYGDNDSKCSNKCSAMGGRRIDSLREAKPDCECKCRPCSRTFGFYERKWKCAIDDDISRNAGCSIVESALYGDNTIPTISLTYFNFLEFEDNTRNKDGRCNSFGSIPENNLSYFACNGAWKPLDYSILENSFRISIVQAIQEPKFIANIMSMRYHRDQIHPLLAGRIIKVGIECRSPPKRTKCFLVKVEGQLSCPTATSVTPTPFKTTTKESMTTKNMPTVPQNWSPLPPNFWDGIPGTCSNRVSPTRGSWNSIASSVAGLLFSKMILV